MVWGGSEEVSFVFNFFSNEVDNNTDPNKYIGINKKPETQLLRLESMVLILI